MIVEWVKTRWRDLRAFISKRHHHPVTRGVHNRRYSAFLNALSRHRFVIPLFFSAIFSVYLMMGGIAFLFIEFHSPDENTLSKHRFHQLLNRRQYAREISDMIFNDTQNMLIIIDKTHSKRIHENLMTFLKDYEMKLFELQNQRHAPFGPTSLSRSDYGIPSAEENWTLRSSLNYAWALLTTIGHATRQPRTISGQAFAICYCLLGVPFYILTMILVARFFVYVIMEHSSNLRKNRALVALTCAFVYYAWLILFATIVFENIINENFWYSFFTAAFSSLSIQSHFYNSFDEREKMLTLFSTSVSLLLSFVIVLLLFAAYEFCPCFCELKSHRPTSRAFSVDDTVIKSGNKTKSAPQIHPQISSPFNVSKVGAINSEPRQHSAPPPRLQLLIDDSGKGNKVKVICTSPSPTMIDEDSNLSYQ